MRLKSLILFLLGFSCLGNALAGWELRVLDNEQVILEAKLDNRRHDFFLEGHRLSISRAELTPDTILTRSLVYLPKREDPTTLVVLYARALGLKQPDDSIAYQFCVSEMYYRDGNRKLRFILYLVPEGE